MNPKQAFNAAIEYRKKGDMVKAARVLRGVQHPRCEALLERVKRTPEYKRHVRNRRITYAIVALLVAAMIALALLMNHWNTRDFARFCATQSAQGHYFENCYSG